MLSSFVVVSSYSDTENDGGGRPSHSIASKDSQDDHTEADSHSSHMPPAYLEKHQGEEPSETFLMLYWHIFQHPMPPSFYLTLTAFLWLETYC